MNDNVGIIMINDNHACAFSETNLIILGRHCLLFIFLKNVILTNLKVKHFEKLPITKSHIAILSVTITLYIYLVTLNGIFDMRRDNEWRVQEVGAKWFDMLWKQFISYSYLGTLKLYSLFFWEVYLAFCFYSLGVCSKKARQIDVSLQTELEGFFYKRRL